MKVQLVIMHTLIKHITECLISKTVMIKVLKYLYMTRTVHVLFVFA
jgi:hypothetical protein